MDVSTKIALWFAVGVPVAIGMELWAALLHGRVWHGLLWPVHKSHHAPRGRLEANDILSFTHAPIAIVLILIGMPVAFALGLGALSTLLFDPNLPLTLVPQRMFTALDSWPIMAVPLFMLAGGLMDKGGMSRRIVEFASACLGFIGPLPLIS